MVFLSMLHHFNYLEFKYYIYSHFSFHLNLLAVFYIDFFILIHTNDTFTFVFMKVRLYYATAAHLEMSTNR